MASVMTSVMERVLELAEKGRFSTSPNPRVGAVVRDADRQVAGEGFHERAGLPHAEVVALEKAGERARGGTLYLNLEPCAHHGRTPPCVDAVIASGVTRVVCSMLDPDPRTAGRGVERLREAGIAVDVGAFAERAERLNEAFLLSAREGRPFVHVRWASSLDGKIATRLRESRWISSLESRAHSMRLREEYDAILVGAGTVVDDDPLLTRRLGLSSSILPHRKIVIDGALRVRPTARVFENGEGTEAWLATARPGDDPALVPFYERGVRVLSMPTLDGHVDLRALLAQLHGAEVRSLLVEGGGETSFRFLEASLADRVTAYFAPVLIGGSAAPGALGGAGFERLAQAPTLAELEVEPLGPDLRVSGRVAR
jgi:diaminohydroxyphosphoribosylaminopyrimidine deaminase/5-amino-6-(5-phosphoribosylamino)uracil reductase